MTIEAAVRKRGRVARGAQQSQRKRRTWSPLRLAIVVAISGIYLYPLVFMVLTALKPTDEYLQSPAGWPSSLTLEHFRNAWENAHLGRALVNSLIAVGLGVVICTMTVSLAAFWFARHRGRVASSLLASFGSLWVVPQVIWLMPLFVILSTFELTSNLLVLGVVYGTVYAPAFIWLVWAYFLQALPPAILEAAELDGAGPLRQYWHIVLPLSKPALAVVAALAFIMGWGDLLLAVVLLQDPELYTVVPAASTLVTRLNAAVQTTTAAAVLLSIPSFLVFLVAQKAIVRGITSGFGK